MYSEDIDFTTYWRDVPTCKVIVRGQKVDFENFTDNPIQLPFGVNTVVNRDSVEAYFEERCFPRERVNCSEVLHKLGLSYYEPELICRKTHGRQFEDFCWIQFEDEIHVTFEDIRLR